MSDNKTDQSDDIEWDELDFDFEDSEPEEVQKALEAERANRMAFFHSAISVSTGQVIDAQVAELEQHQKVEIAQHFDCELRYLQQALANPAAQPVGVLLVAILQVPFLRQSLSLCFSKRPDNLIAETDYLAHIRRQLLRAVTKKPPGNQDKLDWYRFQEQSDSAELSSDLKALSSQLKRALVRHELSEFFRLAFGVAARVDDDGELSLWWQKNSEPLTHDVAFERSQNLKIALADVVKGQSQAIEALCDGYAQSFLGAGAGPRGIFTLLGETGTGKTLLAETFADELSDVEGDSYQLLRFDMQQFSDPRAAAALFGSSYFYADATLGELTDQVRNYPKSVILFDEIEKAHAEVIQSLLGVLDRGEIQDSASLKWADFSQAFILFTTNLGSQRLADRRGSGQILGTLDNATLGSLLRHDPASNNQYRLSPEFINRLTKGRFLAFEALKPEKLLGIYASSWNARREEIKTESVVPPYCTNELATLYLLKRLPDLSARTAASSAQSDLVECMKCLVEAANANSGSSAEWPDPAARLTGSQELLDAMLVERGLDRPPAVLLLDDDQETLGILRDSVACSVDYVPSDEELASRTFDDSAEFVLVDLFIENDDTQHRTAEALNRIIQIRQLMPQADIVAFCKNPRNSAATHQAMGAARAIDGVSQVLSYESEDAQGFTDRIRDLLAERRLAGLIGALLRERKRLLFSWRAAMSGNVMTISPSIHRLEPVLPPGSEGRMFGLGEIPELTLNDVVGNERGVRQISRALGWLKHGGRIRQFGFRPPAGYLLAGPPGTGKTFLARAAAGECGLPFFSINAAELLSPMSGQSEALLRNLFENARKLAPSVIFFDEIDAIATQRGAHGSQQGLVNTLLSEMDGFGGHERPVLVLAATNHPSQLDSALKRPGRLDEIIVCDLPNAAARTLLLQKAAEKLNISLESQRIEQLVLRTQGESAAAIEAAARHAVYNADALNRDPKVIDLEASIQQLVYGTVREDLSLAKEEKWAVACHEAGHALAIHALFPGRTIDYITIQPRTGSLGFVSLRDDSPNARGGLSMTLSEIRSELAVALAGREAERLVLGADGMSAGAASDLRHANGLVRRAIMECGLDEQLGPMAVGQNELHADPALAALCTARCREWLSQAELTVKELLTRYKADLEQLAEQLFQKENLEGEELLSLLPRKLPETNPKPKQ